MSNLVGKWSFVSQENYEQYLLAIDVGMMKRKLIADLKPDLNFARDGDKWSWHTLTTLKNIVTSAIEGVEFVEETLEDITFRSLVRIDGDKMIQEQRNLDGNLVSTIERQVDGDFLTTVYIAGDVVAKRIFKRA